MKRPFAESSRTSTSSVAESFTEDIIVEILLRLPAKSLMRFKCVGKRWQSLISDLGFARSHLQRLKAGDMVSSQRIFKTDPLATPNYEVLDGGFGDDDHEVVKYHETRMDASSWYPNLVGCRDGLVCLSVQNSSRFVLYNPTTRECRNLPGSELFRLDELLHGFGYDSRSDDYKIVQRDDSEKWQDSSNWQVVMFSLKSGSRKRTQAQLESHLFLIERGGGVYWNGALHWVGIDQSKQKPETAMISFDLLEEKFQVLPVLEASGQLRFKGLGIHGVNLFIYHGCPNESFQAWITSDYGKGGSWTNLFSVSTEGIPNYCLHKIPVTYTRSGKIVFQIGVYQMILFNPEDNTYKSHLQRLKVGDMVSSQRIVKTNPLETINYKALDGCGGGGGCDDRAVVKFHEADPSSWPELVGSCDGLVCLSVNSSSFILYNPTTKESSNLPGSDIFQLDEFLYGFGYDSRSDDYKIVQRKSPEKWQDTHENWQVAIFAQVWFLEEDPSLTRKSPRPHRTTRGSLLEWGLTIVRSRPQQREG
ncbi:hypothetical protein NL676_023481 [Syzygium grande]|nr:hypothetical protein NL676_023481 [Syzygium grande]